MHYKDTCSSSFRGRKSTCDSQEDFPNYEIWTRCNNPKTDSKGAFNFKPIGKVVTLISISYCFYF